ncbi:MAG: TIGR01212 family radical SAM protein [Clostridia bacterium]|nr:TIGR01212 family radical SAM protein [Clostridia bacterium]
MTEKNGGHKSVARSTQTQRNPFPFSDSNKRYHTYDYYLRRTFGGKCAKIPLDAGFTCPNIDGRCGVGGCIYCSGRGSGDFAEEASVPLRQQYEIVRTALSSKWSVERCIPYFQAHTNTYAPTEVLQQIFEEALTYPGAVGLNIATRADCLTEQTVRMLSSLAERTVLTVELGLQSVHDLTAARINRGHTYAQFLDGYERLGQASRRIGRCVHLIFGLPGEDDDMMMESVRRVAALKPEQVKLHLLHVLRGTALGEMYERGAYTPLTRERYISLVARALTLLPPETVIGRLTGDGMGTALLAPDWSRRKVSVINDIDKTLYENDLWQGCARECADVV